MSTSAGPLISAIGIVSRDELQVVESWPREGSFTTITERLVTQGGTTGNIATGLARLGARVRLFAKVGEDEWGNAAIQSLRHEGVETADIVTGPGHTELSIILVTADSRERTILWDQGPTLSRGDQINIDRLFNAELTVVDAPDYELCRFLTDLPAHTYPQARLLGTLSYLAKVVAHDKLDVACRFDVLVGNEREYCLLTGDATAEKAFETVRSRMAGSNLRTAAMTQGAGGSVVATSEERINICALPVNPVDTTGAGDAFVAGFAYAIALRWDLQSAASLASGVASFVVGAFGARSGLPSLPEALSRVRLVENCDHASTN